MKSKSRIVIGLVAAAALILAACGGGDAKPPQRPTPPLPTATKDELARVKSGISGANKDIIGTPAFAKLTPEPAEKPARPASAKPAAAPRPPATNPGQMLIPDASAADPPPA